LWLKGGESAFNTFKTSTSFNKAFKTFQTFTSALTDAALPAGAEHTRGGAPLAHPRVAARGAVSVAREEE